MTEVTILHNDGPKPVPKGAAPESWCCVDCGVNTAPGALTRALMEFLFQTQDKVQGRITRDSEVYTVHDNVWKQAPMTPDGGCLCIGCLEHRLGRKLRPRDFPADRNFNRPDMPGTERLLERRRQ
jgi:hypothetical protein